ncbi:hypothetical protein PLICRDRAFT_248864 [Plicaturopsis crispa FD-325 SS-3]|nr:hypothetical protein PLICRDRAFT_248864 [Plicaturopsis crispa FD-325 SS-3]
MDTGCAPPSVGAIVPPRPPRWLTRVKCVKWRVKRLLACKVRKWRVKRLLACKVLACTTSSRRVMVTPTTKQKSRRRHEFEVHFDTRAVRATAEARGGSANLRTTLRTRPSRQTSDSRLPMTTCFLVDIPNAPCRHFQRARAVTPVASAGAYGHST